MAFIDDDAVEKLRGIFLVVDDLFRRLRVGPGLLEEGFFLCGFIHFLVLQDGIHPLNGADADLDVIGDIGAVQAANTVKLGKGAVVVIRRIGKEFPLRLFAQRFGVYKEQDALHLAELQQAVCRRDRRKGLACAGCHLD